MPNWCSNCIIKEPFCYSLSFTYYNVSWNWCLIQILSTSSRELVVFDKTFQFSFPVRVGIRKFYTIVLHCRNHDSTYIINGFTCYQHWYSRYLWQGYEGYIMAYSIYLEGCWPGVMGFKFKNVAFFSKNVLIIFNIKPNVFFCIHNCCLKSFKAHSWKQTSHNSLFDTFFFTACCLWLFVLHTAVPIFAAAIVASISSPLMLKIIFFSLLCYRILLPNILYFISFPILGNNC